MPLQVVALVRLVGAEGAGVRPFARVRKQVAFEVVRCEEACSTDGALVYWRFSQILKVEGGLVRERAVFDALKK